MEAFLAVSTQWRWLAGGLGGAVRTGLDYAGVVAGLALAGIEMTPELWADVQTMEIAARDAANGEGR